MIYLKKITRKLDKYIKNKNKKKYKKLEVNLLKFFTSSNVSNNLKSYKEL